RMWLPQHHASSAAQRGGPKAATGLWKLLGKDREDLSPAEEKAVSSLSVLHRRLPVESGRVNTKSEAGFNACAAFLDKVASVAALMRLETVPPRRWPLASHPSRPAPRRGPLRPPEWRLDLPNLRT
ncbi:unnamed protein product, partial [Prorocentrum cordatum]